MCYVKHPSLSVWMCHKIFQGGFISHLVILNRDKGVTGDHVTRGRPGIVGIVESKTFIYFFYIVNYVAFIPSNSLFGWGKRIRVNTYTHICYIECTLTYTLISNSIALSGFF